VQYLPEVLFANSFGKVRQGDPNSVSLDYYEEIFGKELAPKVLHNVEQYSDVPFNISRLIWSHTEGFTWKHYQGFSGFGGKSPKSSGIGESLIPPEWARREIVPLAEYVSYLKDNPWDDEFLARITGDGKNPIEFLEDLTKKAKGAKDTLVRLAKSCPASAADEMDLLIKSADIAYLTGLRWSQLFKARLLFAGAKSQALEAKRKELAGLAVAAFEKGKDVSKKIRPILESYPPNLVDPKMALNPQKMEEKARAMEFEMLKEDLADLLGGGRQGSRR